MALTGNSRICKVPAWKVQGQEIKAQQDLLASESLLTLSINGLKSLPIVVPARAGN